MAQYRKCNACGAHLDAGERCDCTNSIGVRGMTAREREIARTPGAIILLEKRPGERMFTWRVCAGG